MLFFSGLILYKICSDVKEYFSLILNTAAIFYSCMIEEINIYEVLMYLP